MAKRVEVYDFMYVDGPRIRSLISQLHDIGVLDELTETDEAEHTRSSHLGGTIGAKPIVSSEADKNSSRATREAQHRRYDVQYALPIDLIDMLEGEGLVTEKPNDFRFGSIARFTGAVHAMDLGIFEGSWGNLADMADGMKEPGVAKAIGSMLSKMPPSIQAVLTNRGAKVWTNLLREHWLVPPTNFGLSHGTKIGGDWTVLGVVDALPDDPKKIEAIETPSTMMAGSMDELMTALRQMMGRPSECFGFSPILVYRKVIRKR